MEHKNVNKIWQLKCQWDIEGRNVYLSIVKINYTPFFLMQVCCGSEDKLVFSEEILAKYPECRLENVEGTL